MERHSNQRSAFKWLSLVLAVTLSFSSLPAIAMANDGGVKAASSAIATLDNEAGETGFSVDGYPFVFTKLDAAAKTLRIGTDGGTMLDNATHGNGIAQWPSDHKITIPATVAIEGEQWAVAGIADCAFQPKEANSNDYVDTVTVEAPNLTVGQYAFAGLGASSTKNFSISFSGEGSLKSYYVNAFNFIDVDEFTMPEGVVLYQSEDKSLATDSFTGNVPTLNYPVGFSGTIYQASANVESLRVLSPYTSFSRCAGLQEVQSGRKKVWNTAYPTSINITSSSKTKEVYLWADSNAETTYLAEEKYSVGKKATFDGNSNAFEGCSLRHMAVLQDNYTISGTTKPSDVEKAYGAQSANVKLNNATDNVISGTAEIPDGMLSVVEGDDVKWTLKEGTDYTVNYYASQDVTEALASAPVTAGTYWVEFVGNDKTAWGKTERYKLTLSESKTMLAGEDVTLTIPEGGYTYDGTAKEPSVAVSHNGTSLTAGTDYTVTYSDNTDAGTATATVTGIGSYAGAVPKEFAIGKAVLTETGATVGSTGTYCGKEWTPATTVKIGSLTVPESEYDLTYANNVEPGTATVAVKIKEDSTNYTGSASATFEISPISMDKNVTTEERIKKNEGSNVYNLNPLNGQVFDSSVYTGEYPALDLSSLVGAVNYGASGSAPTIVPLTAADYNLGSWTGGADVGEKSITLTGKNHFTGDLVLKWTIKAKSLADDDVVVSGLDDQAWTGSAVTPPEPVVKVGERTLVKGTDYGVVYPEDLTNAGAKQVTITGKGNYTGSPEGTSFRIGKSLANAEVIVADADRQVYTGSPLTPAVTVKVGEDTLTKERDYTVSYSNSTNAGTATVTITGADDYVGTMTKTFEIAKAEVAVPSAVAGLKYTGKAQTGVVVADGAGYTATGTTGTNAGPYTATLTADSNHVFADGKTTAEVAWSIAKAASSVSLAAQSKTYTGKALAYSGKVTKSGSTGKVTYKYYSNAACTKAATPKAAGTYYVKATVAANANYAAATSAAAKFTIEKAANPLAVKAASKTLKAKAVKKKAQSFTPSVVKTKGQGTLSYAKGKVSKKSGNFTVNKKTGKITVKKGTPKGTYTVQVKVTAAGNANYKASAAKVAKVTVKVK